ncbi:MAG: CpaF family protein [Candidatus Omnitrophica bacterium]|nr:CpaF family protein [Candidatus Omnitrophota bacterium]MDD5080484.1 CpaF family protein [Candidatus Omnitrophota bacterium]MDD5440744.1 CpaF family protein [Candidatus Omnitrophota bacterium]
MELHAIKKELRRELSFTLGEGQSFGEAIIRERVEKIFNFWESDGRVNIDDQTREKIIRELILEFLGFGPLQEPMNDPEVTEIMVNGPDSVYIEKDGKKQPTDIKFDNEQQLRHMVEKMIRPTGRRVDESYPYVDFSLTDGSRVNVILPPLSVGGATVTIRKFLKTINRIDDLVTLGTIDDRMAKFIVACIEAKANIMFSGATGSGKTTTLEVLTSYLDPQERIIVIEDTLELSLRQKHVVRLLTRPPNIEGRGEVMIRDLFVNTLRMRPTRIILGEIRGAEAMDYLQALNSGHGGCLSVIHASSPYDALTRLETMALYAGLYMPVWAVRKQIASGLNIIVQHDQLIDGTRKITHITEVKGVENEEIILNELFTYELDKVDENGKVQGSFKAVNKPSFMNLFKRRGVKLDESIFTPDK